MRPFNWEPFRPYDAPRVAVWFTPLILVLFGYVMVRMRVGFPFPPHSRADWGALAAYLVAALFALEFVLVVKARLQRRVP